jgi:uncharacterized membrane protein YkvA (DUF1232 family)
MTRFARWFKRDAAATLWVRLLAVFNLLRHAQTPRLAKWVGWAVIAYAVSPIDLIPDFIPLLGLLDDLLLLPLGIALVVRLTPPALWQECLRKAELTRGKLPRLWWGALAVVLTWLALLALFGVWLVRLLAAA